MNANRIRVLTAVVVLAAAAGAHAEYKCHAPPSRVDERACVEAKKGPDALRRFVQRMAWIATFLQFDDYIAADATLARVAGTAGNGHASAPLPAREPERLARR